MIKTLSLTIAIILGFTSLSFAVNTKMIERGMDDLSYARTQLRRLIDDNARNRNDILISQLRTIEDLLSQSHQNIASGLYGDRPDEPGTDEYKWICRSEYSAAAIGKGWTKLEARAKTATLCKKEKPSNYCDDESEFSCESIPNAFPRAPLNYSKVCISNYSPGAIGFGWTNLEARAAAGAQCLTEKTSNYCDDTEEFTCENVDPSFIGNSRIPYRYACLSNYAPGAIGKGLSKTEAIGEAAKICKTTKTANFCDDDNEFTCEVVQ